tara:strand:+ start:86 stop:433 length:348 start_codon:yes stop_codon:yes gene_type:complete
MTEIYHNPRCSKSRQTLQLLKENNINARIVLYLETPPSATKLKNILKMLNMDDPRQLMRKKEPEYKENNLQDKSLTPQQLIESMTINPRLIERPIVIHKGKAILGRPPENVLDII